MDKEPVGCFYDGAVDAGISDVLPTLIDDTVVAKKSKDKDKIDLCKKYAKQQSQAYFGVKVRHCNNICKYYFLYSWIVAEKACFISMEWSECNILSIFFIMARL